MALEKMTEDVAVHQTLGDEPNEENGLTGDDLKKLFDRPAELLKEFINSKLVPNAVDKRGDAMQGALSVATPTRAEHAATKAYVDGLIVLCRDGEPAEIEEGKLYLFPEEE
jgi:hypothetical protein